MTRKTENDQMTQFLYNTENRLERVEDADGNLIGGYYYDPFGRRLWKEVEGTRTYFFYTDEGLNAEFDDNGTEIKSYGFKPNSIWSTDPLFMKVNSKYYFYHNDHLGTPHKMTAVNGALVWGAQYEAFGKVAIDPNSSVENNLRFPGQYFDKELGYYYNLNRYYEPLTGRYFTTDPIGFIAGVNLFTYTLNNPVNYIDPSGLAHCTYSITQQTLICTSNTAFDPEFIGPPEQRKIQDNCRKSNFIGPCPKKGVIHSGRGKHINNPNSVDVKNYGPIKPGLYNMFPNEKPNREGWWSLKDKNWIPGLSALSYKLGLRRAGSNLHLGGSSWGCITVNYNNKKEYDLLTDLLRKELGKNTLEVIE